MASFRVELEAYILQLNRVEAVAKTTTVAEVQAYQDMVRLMDQEKLDTIRSIEELKKELVNVQQDRKNKLEYDQLASEIMKYGTRDELESQLESLRTTIENLTGESAKYSDIMNQSKARFEGIAKELKELQADVGFEVGERERRAVERDGEGDAEEEVRIGEEALDATTADLTMEHKERARETEEPEQSNDKRGRSSLNASAAEFKPRATSRGSTPGGAENNQSTTKESSSKRRRSLRRADGNDDVDEENENSAIKRAREEGEMSEVEGTEEESEEGAA